MLMKRLNSKIEGLFTSMTGEEYVAPQPAETGKEWHAEESSPRKTSLPSHSPIVGHPLPNTFWSWETDTDLNYTFCSSEIQSIFNVSAQEFLGKSILTFGVHPTSYVALADTFSKGIFPGETNVTFSTPDGKCIPGRLYILSPAESGSSVTGWRGYAQSLSGSAERPTSAFPEVSVHPAPTRSNKKTDPLSRSGEQSLSTNTIVISNSSSEGPAAIAVPLHLQNYGEMLLEIIDESGNRSWSEDDRFLVIEVGNQLGLALDNAYLYQSVQQELKERIRAEQETLRRNKDLATLNQIGQRLGRLATRAEIFELLASMIDEVLGSRDFYICVYSEDSNILEYPIYRQNGLIVAMPSRPLGKGIPEYIVRTRSPLLVTKQSAANFASYGIILEGPPPASVIAIPILAGERLIGAIVIQEFHREGAYDELNLELLSTAASQAATALENSQAYELSQKAIAEMKELDRVKSQFLANMSHELRTPLNSIIGFSRVIIKGYDGPVSELQRQDLDAIYQSGQHLLHLINDILDLSKIEAGKMELTLNETSLADIIKSAMSTAVGLVKDKPIQLRTHIPDSLPSVWADATRVRQVLINLLSNAVKFTEEGTITVEAAETKGPNGKQEIMVTVIDTGSGISPADQPKLFIPFSQVDNSPARKTGGTGLGLSISKSLIDMHEGRIGLLRSEVDRGSAFFFTLPVISLEMASANPGDIRLNIPGK